MREGQLWANCHLQPDGCAVGSARRQSLSEISEWRLWSGASDRMSRGRPKIRQRMPIFVGCEGESERGYVALLDRLAEQQGLAIHLDSVLLRPGGGDPCSLIELAARKLAEKLRKRGVQYHAKVVLLDQDLLGRVPDRDNREFQIAAQAGIRLIWQSPCHEALLLRHLEGCQTLRPLTTPLAVAQLRREWPAYEKGMAAAELAGHLDLMAIRRAAEVEPELSILLQTIGLAA